MLVLALGIAGVLVVEGPSTVVNAIGRTLHRALDDSYDENAIDTDGDGIPDVTEREGWRTESLGTFRTSPRKADTDRDGLPDGMEAGDLVNETGKAKAYVGIADPTRVDTDGDGLHDGDDYFLGMSPMRADTDSDGLADKEELAFGSDPTQGNEDGDSYTDVQERKNHSDPLAYDLTGTQKVSATIAGFGFGDWAWGAQHVGRMNDTQLESPEYLGGELVSGYVGIGDVRDALAGAGTLDIVGVVVNLSALVPLAGDAAKTVGKLTKFAARGGRADHAVVQIVDRLPWKTGLKNEVLHKVFRRSPHPKKLPPTFRDPPGAPRDNVVYKSVARPGCLPYVGISKNFPARRNQHSLAGRCIEPQVIEGMTGLTRNEARAVEEYCIRKGGRAKYGGGLSNERSSINAKTLLMDEILGFAEGLLQARGGTCPL